MTTTKQLTLPGAIVKKSNEIVRSRMRLENVYAARVFTGVIACIKDTDRDFQEYVIPASAVINPDDMGGRAYLLIRQALKTIAGYTVEIPLPIESERDKKEPPYAIYPLFSKAQYREGKITAQVHPDLKPHFIALATQYTSYNLLDYLKLSGTYSQRLFEILNSYSKTEPYIKIDIHDLHRMLNTATALQKRFPDLRRRVLEPAYKEINIKTDLEYEWNVIKKGRNVVSIEFVFSKRKKEEAQKIQIEKERKAVNKYSLQAFTCWKEKGGKASLVKDRCPDVKPKTKKCAACKKMEYFAI